MKFLSFGVLLLSAQLVATQQPVVRTVPDLEGVWNFATLTPLERPAQLADQEFLSDAEAAAFVRDTMERNNRDRRDGGAEVDVARAVNDGWFDRGTSLARVKGRFRTAPMRVVAPRWLGEPRGRWEGNTLVVDSIHFNGINDVRGSDDQLHLTERFTRVDRDTLLYEFTVDNPTAFATPWSAVLPMTRSDDRLFEYACHEANYALMDILRGARAGEQR
jgi:hypothetical protein